LASAFLTVGFSDDEDKGTEMIRKHLHLHKFFLQEICR
jgi:hypothetical protein